MRQEIIFQLKQYALDIATKMPPGTVPEDIIERSELIYQWLAKEALESVIGAQKTTSIK